METLFSEIRLFLSRIQSLRSILLHLALLGAFGIWIPRLKSLDFLDPQVLGAYACLGLIFAGPATAQSFTGDTSASFAIARARILVGVLYGEVVVLTLLAAGIATVDLTNRGSFVPTPDWETLAKSAALGVGASALIASMAAWATVRYSRRIALVCLRLAFFALLILFFYKAQRLPEVGLYGAAVCFAAAGVFIILLKKACR